MLNWTADHLVHNYGWAIILVTVAINLLLFPLHFTSMKSSKKMQTLQPQIAAINAKYKDLSMRDPKKADQNQEIMDLYKREGVNPVGGCLPMVLQLPFFFAFYKVLSVAIELRGAHWLWVHDLSQPETLAIHVLPVMLIVTQFLTQKMTPSPGVDPSQQKMMMVMPLVFGYMFYFRLRRAGTILVDRQLGGHRSAVAVESRHAYGAGGSGRETDPEEEEIGNELPEKKYTLAEAGPRIEEFLNHDLRPGRFQARFTTVAEGETPHPDFENPDLAGPLHRPRRRPAAGEQSRAAAGAGAVDHGSAGHAGGGAFADLFRRQRPPHAAHRRAAHERAGRGRTREENAARRFTSAR